MATPALPSHPGPDHQVSVKVLFNDSNRRFKLPLKDLQAQVLPQKVSYLVSTQAPTGPSVRPRPLISMIRSVIAVIDHPMMIGNTRLACIDTISPPILKKIELFVVAC
jgi:hypothetical protein